MADPQAATLTQLRNIQIKTGKTIAQLHAVLAASGLAKTGELRSLLMERFKLGYGDANAVALFMDKPLPDLGDGAPAPVAAPGDPLDTLYIGAKAALRPLHVALMNRIEALGAFEEAPKKAYISLRRKKQFAMLGPATQSLRAMPPGGMCQYTVRISAPAEIDAELLAWIEAAYASAG